LGKGFPLAQELGALQAVRMSTLRNFLRQSIIGGAALLVATTLSSGCKTACGKVAATPPAAQDELLARIPDNFAFAAAQYERLLATITNDPKLPRTFERGRVVTVTPEDWTSGFFPGSLWFLYEYTNDPKWLAAATNYTERLDRIKNFRGHHDVGFMLGCSYWQGLRLTKNPAYRDVLVQGARSLATRYKPEVGLIRSWDFGRWKYPVIMDNLMNLELLTFAARESGEQKLYDIAVEHADKTLQNHFRADFSSYHVVDYNPTNGTVLRKMTQQGTADESAWARGQAWGLYGYTAMFRETGDPAYLAQAVNIANYLRNHPRLPADKIPYWDFDAPGIPNAPRDASAAAIISSALLELSGFVPKELAMKYVALAREQLLSLSSPAYRAASGANGNFILKHSVGSHPEGREIDVPLNYADYYFLEALLRYQALPASNKCGAK
jgi:unsaturated chondroitin disaccharide hydrolase